MWSVVAALTPAIFGSIYFFGLRFLLLIFLSIISALVSEAIFQKASDRKITITDGSAIITGIILVFLLPPGVPMWLPLIGSAFAIVFAKQLFGGLGYNYVNPALAGWAFLILILPYHMIITTQTSTTVLKLLLGNTSGHLGETSVILLFIGAIYLLITKVINYRIPISYLGTVTILSLVLPTTTHPQFFLLSGNLFLGVFFIATDYLTTPVTKLGQWVFGIGCGILTIVIRTWISFSEGVYYSILLMNLFTPLIDRYTRPKVFGTGKNKIFTAHQ
jgi:electron transport complex protein RnfD